MAKKNPIHIFSVTKWWGRGGEGWEACGRSIHLNDFTELAISEAANRLSGQATLWLLWVPGTFVLLALPSIKNIKTHLLLLCWHNDKQIWCINTFLWTPLSTGSPVPNGQISKWKHGKKRHLKPLWAIQEDLGPNLFSVTSEMDGYVLKQDEWTFFLWDYPRCGLLCNLRWGHTHMVLHGGCSLSHTGRLVLSSQLTEMQ